MSPRGKRVTASQVGQYTYCAHAWWLSVIEKREPTDMVAIETGLGTHEHHGWEVSFARGASKLALAALAIALLALAAWALLTFVR